MNGNRQIVIWSLDEESSELGKLLRRFLEYEKHVRNRCTLFSPTSENPIDDLRYLLRENMAPQNHGRNAVPGEHKLVFLASASSEEALHGLSVLPSTAQMLCEAVAGACPITLITFIPERDTAKDSKIQICRFFVHLEQITGSFSGLEHILVHPCQLVGDNKIVDRPYPRCFEMLYRELMDHDFQDVFNGVGAHAAGNLLKVGNRLASYSSGNAIRFIYEADRWFRYLSSRFQIFVFKKGLMNIADLMGNPVVSSAVQKRADEFAARICQLLQPPILEPAIWNIQKPVSSPMSPEIFKDATSRLRSIMENLKQWALTSDGVLSGQSAAQRSIEPTGTWITNVLSEWKQRAYSLVKDEFLDALTSLPGWLAGGKCFLQALAGKDLLCASSNTKPKLAGIQFFQGLFCQRPLLEDLNRFCAQRLGELRHDQQLPNAVILQSLEKPSGLFPETVQETLRLTNHEEPRNGNVHTQLLHNMVSRVNEHSNFTVMHLNEAGRLLESLLSEVTKTTESLNADIQRAEQSILDLNQELAELKNNTSWMDRTLLKRVAYMAEKEKKEASLHQLKAEPARFQSLFSKVLEDFFDLLNGVFMPHLVRAGINQVLFQAITTETSQFDSFLSLIEKRLQQGMRHSLPKPPAERIDISVCSGKRIKLLYDRTVQGMTPKEAVSYLLVHQSPKGWNGKKPDRSYLKCSNLKEHYLEGAESFLQRLEDQAGTRFSPVLQMTVLDILEMEDQDHATDFLINHFAIFSPERFFSSVFMPQTTSQGFPQRVLLARTGESLTKQLQQGIYPGILENIWQTKPQFLENDDSTVLDLTWFAFGLPAYLIHAMDECRRLYLEAEGDNADDLWPA